ncbi:hypothetical protein OHA25_28630 [Nonomuraea sp. NBC_00507]|uniref:hypothetical protein n=1 Tax=Nonomuraea sp. NBC_00507 TaxID=2976002 RepID=UPI002E170B84
MGRRLVINDLRVQSISHHDGHRSFTIVWPEGTVHEPADRFLRRHERSGTQRTYAYLLVDHLRWLEREALALEAVSLRDLATTWPRWVRSGAAPTGSPGEPTDPPSTLTR